MATCSCQPGSGWSRRTIDTGLRGPACWEPLQALEPAVLGKLSSTACTPGGHSEGEWGNATIGYPDGWRPCCAGGCPPLPGAFGGTQVPPRLLWVSAWPFGDRCCPSRTSALLALDWVLDIDIKGFFDNIDHELLLKAVRKHTECRWALLYIERWLKAPAMLEDRSLVQRERGTPQGGVISPLLANLFLHYVFDIWLKRGFSGIQFERYADDIICHCRSEHEAKRLHEVLERRFLECGLALHAEKTKVVYCKDTNRTGTFEVQQFDFLGYCFRPRKAKWPSGSYGTSFLPAASPRALKAIRKAVRVWGLQRRSDKALDDLARMFNPYIRGWINY